MQVLFESRDPKGAQMRDLVLSRMHFVLRRLKAYVPWVKVQLSDVNGPRGGSDKRCQVQLKTLGAGDILIQSTGNNWRHALERSLARTTKVLSRNLARAKTPLHPQAKKLSVDCASPQDPAQRCYNRGLD